MPTAAGASRMTGESEFFFLVFLQFIGFFRVDLVFVFERFFRNFGHILKSPGVYSTPHSMAS